MAMKLIKTGFCKFKPGLSLILFDKLRQSLIKNSFKHNIQGIGIIKSKYTTSLYVLRKVIFILVA